jgi:hypothetical protein
MAQGYGRSRRRVPDYSRDMVDRRERPCVPVEMEMIPLYREPAWSARLRREERREKRRQRRRAWSDWLRGMTL